MHEIQEYNEYPWLVFRLLNANYAINTRYVSSVIEVPEVTRSVDACDYIEGLIQVRDKVISLINTAKLFHPQEVYPRPTLAILLADKEQVVAFGMDEVLAVEEIELISKSTEFNKGAMRSQYLYGVGKSSHDNQQAVILLLDDHYLIQSVSNVCD